jgi:hypothetical protein
MMMLLLLLLLALVRKGEGKGRYGDGWENDKAEVPVCDVGGKRG